MPADDGIDAPMEIPADGIRVLQLTASREVFFEGQIEALEARGIDCDVRVVPEADQIDGETGRS